MECCRAMTRQLYKVYLLLGSNMGNREEILEQAVLNLIDALLPDYTEVASLAEAVNTSALYETEPWGFDSKEKFMNQAFTCITELSPHKVLEECLRIERELGRVREGAQFNGKGERIYASRPIDIDILLFYKQTQLPVAERADDVKDKRKKRGENRIMFGGKGNKDSKIEGENFSWELCCIDDSNLVVPHPRLHEREFAKLPMREFVKDAPRGFADFVQ